MIKENGWQWDNVGPLRPKRKDGLRPHNSAVPTNCAGPHAWTDQSSWNPGGFEAFHLLWCCGIHSPDPPTLTAIKFLYVSLTGRSTFVFSYVFHPGRPSAGLPWLPNYENLYRKGKRALKATSAPHPVGYFEAVFITLFAFAVHLKPDDVKSGCRFHRMTGAVLQTSCCFLYEKFSDSKPRLLF